MADEARDGAGRGREGARTPTVFVADASAEAQRAGDMLRGAGYAVVDVPLSMLKARVSVERPNVALVDVDADGALDVVRELRRLPGSGAIDFVYLGTGTGLVKNADDALLNDGSAFFLRPVDLGGLVRKVEALTGGPAQRPEIRPSTPPPSIPSSRSSAPSLPSPGVRTPGPPLPMSTPSLADLVEAPRSLATFGTVSNELAQLLAEAELRAEVNSASDPSVPSPEEEIEAVLPADVLASLDEPIEGDDDEDGGHDGAARTGAGAADREGTGAVARGTTTGGTRQPTTGSRLQTGAHTHERRLATDPRATSATRTGSDPPRRTTDATRTPVRSEATVRPASAAPVLGSPTLTPTLTPTSPPVEVVHRASPDPAPARTELGVVLAPADAGRLFADAVARRASGALCFESDGVVRRIVLRDGDMVTAASSADRESLVQFLAARGDLPRDEATKLADKVPSYGRHAGAALIAHGWLRQDQLWPALRAHAEWIGQAVLRTGSGTAHLETEPAGRLRQEPSVFGGATGAEIFVELVRRAVAPDEAITELGGAASRLADGPHHGLVAECALAPAELDLLARARGGTVGDLLGRSPDAEIACVAYALALLGVFEVVRAVAGPAQVDTSSSDDALLEEEAVRARIRARLELVEEGDYFAVLGVQRDATGYEVRRAFLELRRAFEPAKILTPRLSDLADDVRKIVTVLEEAYEILKDAPRRERYRRAIEARPEL